MPSLLSLKIGPRLALAFGILLVLAGASTYMAISGLDAQRRSSDNATTVYAVISTVHADSMLDLDSARTVRDILLRTDGKAMENDVKLLQQDESESDKNFKRLATLLGPGEGRRLYEDMVAARGRYGSFITQVVKLAMQGRRAEAVAALYGPDSKLQDSYLSTQRRLAAYTESQMALARVQISDTYRRSMLLLLATSIVLLLAGSVLAVQVSRSIVRPLADAARISESVGAGDLRRAIVTQHDDEPAQVLRSLGNMTVSLALLVRSVRSGSDHIAHASREIASGNHDLSLRTEEQAASLEETAASMAELTRTVMQNADDARQANDLAGNAKDLANAGSEAAQSMLKTMEGISGSSTKVSEITGVVEDIAFQTNILALNAAVEAARAGEQGRGFAVVASEVRNLAQRSAAAAKEIKDLIGSSASMIDAGAHHAVEVGRTMEQVKLAITQVSHIVAEIAEASEEQSRGIKQVNQAISSMDDSTQRNAALVEQAVAATHALSEQAMQLNASVSVFKVSDEEEQ